MTSLINQLQRHAIETPDKPALICPTDDDDGVRVSYRELSRRVTALAQQLEVLGLAGERALVLLPSGPEYLETFLACAAARVIAVPLYIPTNGMHAERISKVAKDCGAACVVTTRALFESFGKRFDRVLGDLGALRFVFCDEVDASGVDSDVAAFAAASPTEVAYLQYTSGSTGDPRGVMVTHGNLVEYHRSYADQVRQTASDIGVSWLPLFHDMGLLFGLIHPIFLGSTSVLMPPAAFLQNPARWLRVISRYRGTHSGGPNFAFDLCARKISDEDLEGVDLSSWVLAFNGAEPVRLETIQRFEERFAAYGLRRGTVMPSYGLAEATLGVASPEPRRLAVAVDFDAAALRENRLESGSAGAPGSTISVVSCGRSLPGVEVRIVDPESAVELPNGRVGEVWVRAQSVARGYWGREQDTAQTFGARLASGDGPFLRTGDLAGVFDGALCITGRSKDVVIVRGQNHYPQDLEATSLAAHPALAGSRGAAFSVAGHDGDLVVLVLEIHRSARRNLDGADIVARVRGAVTQQHGISVNAVVLVMTASIRVTTSGKIQRRACREEYLTGTLRSVFEWREAPTIEVPAAVASEAAAQGSVTPVSEPPASAFELEQRVWGWLREANSKLEVQPTREVSFWDLGFDSAESVVASGLIGRALGRTLPPTLLFDHPNLFALVRHLFDSAPIATRPRSIGESERAVAIVGIACRFPGGVADVDQFWSMLIQENDQIGEVPASRWQLDRFYDSNPAAPGKMVTRFGGFIDGVDMFDAPFFGVSPGEADSMDPQQRLLLEVAWEALESAGADAEALKGSRTGVYVGICSNDYARWTHTVAASENPHALTGGMPSAAAGRISYSFGFVGPAISLDTACSSSLVSVHLAAKALSDHECDLALAGGTGLLLSPEGTIHFSKLGAMSPTGRCRSFSNDADGYVRSEGCALLALKRLSDAVRDGDRIFAVVRGSAVNQDGRSNGLTAPNGPSQQAVIEDALARANVKPGELSYAECHATGTPLGDPIEVQALDAVTSRGRTAPLLIGSVKTNIGHTEAAAGVAGLIKAALVVRNGYVPRSLHTGTLNERIPWSSLKLQVATHAQALPAGRRLASVSSFGATGTNAHVVVEGSAPKPASVVVEEGAFVLFLSARNEQALSDLARAYATRLSSASEVEARNIAYCAARRRTHLEHRLAVTGNSAAELLEGLQGHLDGVVHEFSQAGRVRSASLDVVFVFPGQGGQWLGMGRELLRHSTAFKSAMEECDSAILRHAGFSVLSELEADTANSRLSDVSIVQPVLFAVSIALAATWRSLGVNPVAVVGHSQGEIAAAVVAGALTLEEGAVAICLRSAALRAVIDRGAMAWLGQSADECERLIAPWSELSVAAINSPTSTVVSGTREGIDQLLSLAEQREIPNGRIKVNYASHCSQVDLVLPEVLHGLRELAPRASSIPFYSSVTGARIEGGSLGAEYWARNLRQPVRFSAVLSELFAGSPKLFVEMSPHAVLVTSIDECLRAAGAKGVAIGSLRRERPEQRTLLAAVGAAHVAGAPVDLRALFPRGDIVELPRYPWQKRRHWVDTTALAEVPVEAGHPLLGRSVSVAGTLAVFETQLGVGGRPWLNDHRVVGRVVLPAAALLELARAAAESYFETAAVAVEEMVLEAPVLLPEEGALSIQIVLTQDGQSTALSIHSKSDRGPAREPWRRHVRAIVATGRVVSARVDSNELRARCPESTSTERLYRAFAEVHMEYGPAFQAIVSAVRGEGEAVCELRLPEGTEDAGFVLHPALLDAALQSVFAAQAELPSHAELPFEVAGYRLHRANVRRCYVHVKSQRAADGTVVSALALFDEANNPVASIERLVTRPARLDLLGQSAERWLWQTSWRELSVVSTAASPSGTWVVRDDGSPLARGVIARLEHVGARCVVKRHTETANWDSLLAGEHPLAGEVAGVVAFWDEQAAGNSAEQALNRSLAALELFQALGRRRRGTSRLWTVTRAALAVDKISRFAWSKAGSLGSRE